MSNYLNYDNKFFSALGKIVDCCILSVLWIFCSIPIFTIGASSAAMYYTVHKVVRNGKGYVSRTFFDSFKENFKKSTVVWLIQLAALLVVTGDAAILGNELKNGGTFGLLYYFFLVAWFLVWIWIIYACCYEARFVQTKKGILKKAAILAIAHLPWSLLILAIFAGTAVACMYIPVLIFLAPAVKYILYNVIMEKIFRKYMTEEEVRREQQDDMMNDNF